MSLLHEVYSSEINPRGFDAPFTQTIEGRSVITEQAVILGRNKRKNNYPQSADIPGVNGPKDAKAQYVWDGTYSVRLKRKGLVLKKAVSLMRSGRGGSTGRVYVPGEEVTITWLNRNLQIALIVDGNTMDSFNKQVAGRDHLLDPGEEVVRSAIAQTPGATEDGASYPFSDNQFDGYKTASPDSGEYDENVEKIIRNPGGEMFLDKFGRVLVLGRQNSDHEFMITCGKIDTGQDDVSGLTTTTEQDAYYDQITDDESKPGSQDLSEPLAPKSLNTVQYQQIPKTGSLEGAPDSKKKITFGLLPRFDKWKFTPIVIRKYQADSDGQVVDGEVYSAYNERGNCKWSRTITDSGDVKIYIPRHENIRVVGDSLVSYGGNVEVKLKAQDRLVTGASNPNNVYHSEILAEGVVRIRTHENVATGTSRYFSEVSETGAITVYTNSAGGTASNYMFKMTVADSGALVLDSKDEVRIISGSDTHIDSAAKFTVESDETASITSQEDIQMLSEDGTLIAGGGASAELMALGETLETYLDDLASAFRNWSPVPADGGASLKILLLTFLGQHPLAREILSKHNNKVN